jgi:hypothetical protein
VQGEFDVFSLAVHSQLIDQIPKLKAAKAVKAATVKKYASNSEEEPIINVKHTATRASSDIAQECLNDSRWTRTFLQTLSHALYISDHPFTDWAWGSGALQKTIQAVFDISFANISYTVTEQDGIMKAVYVV